MSQTGADVPFYHMSQLSPLPPSRFPLPALFALLVAVACTRPAGEGGEGGGTLVVYNAGSLARPLRAALDSFASGAGAGAGGTKGTARVTIEQENAGSLETARKLTELHKIPDVIALADYEVFPQLLMPEHVRWYAQFARNRMVLAYTSRSRFAGEIDSTNWWRVLQRPGVQVGRADPNLDPNGYRTLLTLRLAEGYYRTPGLYDRLLSHAPPRNIRPKEADLVGILQAGELDYIWSYESLARAAGLSYVHLPSAIDLGDPADSADYARAEVRVVGRTPRDTLTFRGQPIVYGVSIPARAPHPAIAQRFVAYLLSPAGRRVLRGSRLDALDHPAIVGTDAPAAVAAAARE
ncbi:MAG TPA: extracellular solute-binding protein [Gemmatimonadaceae bacterium]|nr:extracellular solute-binding protein [Gemmatimonadaceae bacterium]